MKTTIYFRAINGYITYYNLVCEKNYGTILFPCVYLLYAEDIELSKLYDELKLESTGLTMEKPKSRYKRDDKNRRNNIHNNTLNS